MKTLHVDLGERSYPIYIGKHLLADESLLMSGIKGQEVVVVSNETVGPLYLDKVLKSLSGKKVEVVSLPDGERYKTQQTLSLIYQKMLETHCSRKTTLIALGGGVVGDMTGFAAACYQRGIDFIQLPTTLLSQVDSSVGGKTGVNHPLGKNMIGAFHQPVAVLADIATLDTLPDRELQAGLAEVIKYGLIADKPFYGWLKVNIDRLLKRDAEALSYAVEQSCLNKAAVVAADEREDGVRAILNLGHTFGHAIETAEQYQGLIHGEAVSVGMLMAADMSCRLGKITPEDVDELKMLLTAAGLPVRPPPVMTAAIFLKHMAVDKKVVDGRVRLVLLSAIGQAFISADYSHQQLIDTLEAFCQK